MTNSVTPKPAKAPMTARVKAMLVAAAVAGAGACAEFPISDTISGICKIAIAVSRAGEASARTALDASTD